MRAGGGLPPTCPCIEPWGAKVRERGVVSPSPPCSPHLQRGGTSGRPKSQIFPSGTLHQNFGHFGKFLHKKKVPKRLYWSIFRPRVPGVASCNCHPQTQMCVSCAVLPIRSRLQGSSWLAGKWCWLDRLGARQQGSSVGCWAKPKEAKKRKTIQPNGPHCLEQVN